MHSASTAAARVPGVTLATTPVAPPERTLRLHAEYAMMPQAIATMALTPTDAPSPAEVPVWKFLARE